MSDDLLDPQPPAAFLPAATTLFGDRLPTAVSYAELLMTDGVVRGLVGPREAPRIWERHLLNCATVAELIPMGASVVDVGSGAGLPGLVLAIARPDLLLTLLEPLARRTTFLSEAIASLSLGNARVVRARAEECLQQRLIEPADIVTARAVAPLDRLALWCLPLVRTGGLLLAMKGESAEHEADAHAAVIDRLGGGSVIVRRCGVGVMEPATTVIEVVKERAVSPVRSTAASRRPRPPRH